MLANLLTRDFESIIVIIAVILSCILNSLFDYNTPTFSYTHEQMHNYSYMQTQHTNATKHTDTLLFMHIQMTNTCGCTRTNTQPHTRLSVRKSVLVSLCTVRVHLCQALTDFQLILNSFLTRW